ncbi:Peroxiredoxin [Ectothiorhodospira magna]|uniref:Peroxiredoxin n=1 Tax=Ectothiorhodospira magna TaxID=867345 RepID=A0A1H9B9Z1_9GAMM|nr:TlpA disulfide reductase family protein [Ectothiorhodospira magna]SEP85774.1 Peroxiredoxin [Ectothiorhodospira magna]
MPRFPSNVVSFRYLLPVLLLVLILGFGTVAGFGLGLFSSDRTANSELTGAGMLGQYRPDFVLPDMQGQTRTIAEWDQQVVLINFWATWCPPCRKEMPTFVAMQEAHAAAGFTIVAVAIDEPQAVQDFMDTHGVNFPVLIGEDDAMAVAHRYGNRFGSLPYSVLLDREGHIRYIHAGELTQATLERELQPLL